MGDHASHPHRVDTNVGTPLATPGPFEEDLLRRIGRPPGLRPGHALDGGHRRARRCVDLPVMMELDDLGRLEVRRGHLGEAHHEHGADGEVRGNQAIALHEKIA